MSMVIRILLVLFILTSSGEAINYFPSQLPIAVPITTGNGGTGVTYQQGIFFTATAANYIMTTADLFKTHIPFSTAAQSYTLPTVAASGNGAWIDFTNTAGFQAAGVLGNPLTINRAGADTIFQRNGIQSTSFVLTAGVYSRHETIRLRTNGTYWFVVGGTPEAPKMPGLVDGKIRTTSLVVDTVTVTPYNGNGIALFDTASQQWRLYAISNAGLPQLVTNAIINGVAAQDMCAGGNLNVNFYVYLYLLSGVPAIQFSTTAPAQEAITGYFVKTGDQTQRLIAGTSCLSGGVRLGVGAQNNNTGSYFNRLSVNPSIVVAGNTAAGGWVAITAALTRLTFWTWADGAEPFVTATGTIQLSAVQNCGIGISRDAAAVPQNYVEFTAQAVAAWAPFAVSQPNNANTDGVHTFDLMLNTGTPGSACILKNGNAVLSAQLRG